MLFIIFVSVQIGSLVHAAQLDPRVDVAFTYAIPEGQPGACTFAPLWTDQSPQTLEELRNDQLAKLAEYRSLPNVRGVLSFNTTDQPKTFMWSRDEDRFRPRKCDVWLSGDPDVNVVWDIKAASAAPPTANVKKHVHVSCGPILH